MAAALNATGRPIALYMSCGGQGRGTMWAKNVSNVWRVGNDQPPHPSLIFRVGLTARTRYLTQLLYRCIAALLLYSRPRLPMIMNAGFDHLDCWDDGPCPLKVNYTSRGHGTKQAVAYLTGISKFAGPGGYNTPDFLKTGGESCTVAAIAGDLCPKQTLDEYITEYSVWAMASSPLLVSTDIRNLTAIQKTVLLNTEVIAIDQQPTAGDLVSKPLCLAPPPTASSGLASPPMTSSPAPQWYVAHNIDAMPSYPHEQPGVVHIYGPTPDGATCQLACGANVSCTIYEWSAKSGHCYWRLDGKWLPKPSELRESGCIVGRVAGCGSTGVGSCQVWAKSLIETAYPATTGWSSLSAHYAVALLNLGDHPAVVTANLSAIAPGAVHARDVWGNTTLAVPLTGVLRALVRPHATLLLRVWGGKSL
jgi:hypothetical protein